jgi:hypothetical protein
MEKMENSEEELNAEQLAAVAGGQGWDASQDPRIMRTRQYRMPTSWNAKNKISERLR